MGELSERLRVFAGAPGNTMSKDTLTIADEVEELEANQCDWEKGLGKCCDKPKGKAPPLPYRECPECASINIRIKNEPDGACDTMVCAGCGEALGWMDVPKAVKEPTPCPGCHNCADPPPLCKCGRTALQHLLSNCTCDKFEHTTEEP